MRSHPCCSWIDGPGSPGAELLFFFSLFFFVPWRYVAGAGCWAESWNDENHISSKLAPSTSTSWTLKENFGQLSCSLSIPLLTFPVSRNNSVKNRSNPLHIPTPIFEMSTPQTPGSPRISKTSGNKVSNNKPSSKKPSITKSKFKSPPPTNINKEQGLQSMDSLDNALQESLARTCTCLLLMILRVTDHVCRNPFPKMTPSTTCVIW